jgi:hypothetical protein
VILSSTWVTSMPTVCSPIGVRTIPDRIVGACYGNVTTSIEKSSSGDPPRQPDLILSYSRRHSLPPAAIG